MPNGMLRSKRVRWILAVAALAAVAVGGFAYRNHQRYKHLEVHDPGMVYRSAWLQGEVFAELIEKHQIRTIINLCEPDEMGHERCLDQRKHVRGAGANLVELTMPPTVDATDPAVAKFVEIFSNPDSYPILVHCQHGVTRTAKVLAIYDILHRHMTAQQSIAAMPLFGRDDYNVSVHAFARDFEAKHNKLFPDVAGKLDVLRK
jgi:predicted protein tyrosine phosphatase